MKDARMLSEKVSDVAGYLDLLIDRDTDIDTFTHRYLGLVQWVVEALHLDDNTSLVETPANPYLPLDEDGEPLRRLYNYISAVGMLRYLQSHSCGDIKFAVSHFFHYTLCPKCSHELALERISQYLKRTIEEGLILKPNRVTDKFKNDIFVVAAFAISWGYKTKNTLGLCQISHCFCCCWSYGLSHNLVF